MNKEEFDITKVRFRDYLQGLNVGCEGYVADSLSSLHYHVTSNNPLFYKKIVKIDTITERSFGCDNGLEWTYFYLVKEPKYRPFTWEEREYLRGKWVKWSILDKGEKEFQITSIRLLSNGVFRLNDGITPEDLLENAQFLDGTPCGVLVEGIEGIVQRRQDYITKFGKEFSK